MIMFCRLAMYGANLIEVEVKSYWQLFVAEVFHPFYMFQAGSVVLWALDEYYIYAGCVLGLSVLSVTVALLETRRVSIFIFSYIEVQVNMVPQCSSILTIHNPIFSMNCKNKAF
jgi:hypothetical protein